MEISDLVYGDRIKVTFKDGHTKKLIVRSVGISLFWATDTVKHTCHHIQDIKKIERDQY